MMNEGQDLDWIFGVARTEIVNNRNKWIDRPSEVLECVEVLEKFH